MCYGAESWRSTRSVHVIEVVDSESVPVLGNFLTKPLVLVEPLSR